MQTADNLFTKCASLNSMQSLNQNSLFSVTLYNIAIAQG